MKLQGAAEMHVSAAPAIGNDMPQLVRQCAECRERLPVTAFDESSKSSKYVCKKCTNKHKTAMKKAGRQRRRVARVSEFIDKISDEKGTPRTDDLLKSMLGQFGGINGFADQWYNHIQYLREYHPGSKTLADNFKAFATLIDKGTGHELQAMSLQGMSNDDLVAMLVAQLANESPAALRELIEDATPYRLVMDEAETPEELTYASED